MDGKPPEKRFSAGSVVASIWKNELNDGKGVIRSITLDRSYKDKHGAWKSSNSLRANDLPKASLVLSKAYEYLLSSQGNIEKREGTTEVSER